MEVNKIIPDVIDRQKKVLSEVQHLRHDICLTTIGTALNSEHISIFDNEAIREELRKSILFCDEERLQSYKGKSFTEYLRDKNLSTSQFARLRRFLNDLIDRKIHDFRYLDVIRVVESKEITTPITDQGSGVRSFICIASDILFADEKIILIDEPELGLNPWSKQAFLKLLLEESKSKQIFLATHDPTFVNPCLWRDYDDVSVFFYSPVKEEFVKINLEEDIEDPETFAGYLPHTVSLKPIHIYVEGSSDVYIFQIWLRKYLREHYENWAEMLNKFGVYHLGGGFWPHLLYTIPEKPYKCVIILDGDKRKEVREICGEYDEATINTSKFKFCEVIEKIKSVLESGEKHPVYCLKKDCIEKYLDLECKQSGFNKKIDGPTIAENKDVPQEIQEIFKLLLGDFRM